MHVEESPPVGSREEALARGRKELVPLGGGLSR